MKNVISSEVQGIKLLTNVSTKSLKSKINDSFLMVIYEVIEVKEVDHAKF